MDNERKYSNQQEVEKVIEYVKSKKSDFESKVPYIHLEIRDIREITPQIFNSDGTPKGNLRINDYSRKQVVKMLNTPRPYSGGYLYGTQEMSSWVTVMATPEILNNEDLILLSKSKAIKKNINGIDVYLRLSDFKYGNPISRNLRWDPFGIGGTELFYGSHSVIGDYKRKVDEEYPELKKKIDECNSIISELTEIKKQLPMGDRIIEIEHPYEEPDKSSFGR